MADVITEPIFNNASEHTIKLFGGNLFAPSFMYLPTTNTIEDPTGGTEVEVEIPEN